MKSFRLIVVPIFFAVLSTCVVFASGPRAGFFLPDSVNEMTLNYRTVRGLIVLPVTINDSVEVNLILDTGCRNLILFGKKFIKMFQLNSKAVEFSGLGDGSPVKGRLSIGNKVSINAVLGEQIPVVVVPANNLFGNYPNVHGVIGYDIFIKFEVELNAGAGTITFRSAAKAQAPDGYEQIPLRIVDARPILQSQVYLNKAFSRKFDLMIDTGSSLGLLLKTTNLSELTSHRREKVLGIGFNGPVSGHQITSNKIILQGLKIEGVPTGIVSSQWHNNASIGMEILKDYILVLNYCKAYACFKRNEA